MISIPLPCDGDGSQNDVCKIELFISCLTPTNNYSLGVKIIDSDILCGNNDAVGAADKGSTQWDCNEEVVITDLTVGSALQNRCDWSGATATINAA